MKVLKDFFPIQAEEVIDASFLRYDCAVVIVIGGVRLKLGSVYVASDDITNECICYEGVYDVYFNKPFALN